MSASATTPALTNLSGDAFLYFRAGRNRGTRTSLELSISGGGTLPINEVSLTQGEFTDFMVPIVDATPDTKITFKCSTGGCLFLDEVRIERAIYLDGSDVLTECGELAFLYFAYLAFGIEHIHMYAVDAEESVCHSRAGVAAGCHKHVDLLLALLTDEVLE